MKTVTIFFGEMGCGKSYCASRYAKLHGLDFFEGDSVVTPAMLERVVKFQPIPRHILEEYIEVLNNAIADKMLTCEHLVVAQALYLNKDREEMKTFLEAQGYDVQVWWVKTSFWQNVKNLLTRKDGWKWVCYWLINKPFFQSPKHEHMIYYNM